MPAPTVTSKPAPRPETKPEPPAEIALVSPPPASEDPPAAIAEAPGRPPDPSDYSVHGDVVTVQATETLGHFADWLEVNANDLRKLNKLRMKQPIVIGNRLKLDFSRVSREEFEQRRLEYHQSMQDEFFEAFSVTGTEQHVLEAGESLWFLAQRKYRVPVWLLRQYNPDLDFAALTPGAPLIVPVVEPRGGPDQG
jgi:membrane-bound lytic murein transglycosylase D